VSDYGCAGGTNKTVGNPAKADPIDCTAAAQRAINAAGSHAAANTVVYFGVGRWYLQPPLLLPDGVVVRGDSMETTALYFAQQTMLSAPLAVIAAAAPSVLSASSNSNTSSFGIEDLTVYNLGYYKAIVNISTSTKVRRLEVQ
jgi:hypothetical protein